MYSRIRDVDLYYECHGEGTPFLTLHGFMPDHRLMKGCYEPIFENLHGYKRVYLDLPGMGKSSSADWIESSDDILEILKVFIDEHIGKEAFILAGESYGGYLARGLLCDYKDQVLGLSLLCPLIYPNSQDRNLPNHQVLYKRLSHKDLDGDDACLFDELSVVQTDATLDRYLNEIKPGLKSANQVFLEKIQNKAYGLSFDVDRNLQVFEKPTLFIHGKQDAIVGYKDALNILGRFPRASYSVLDMAGHNLQIEQPELFNALTKEWLERIKKYET
jgi:pimeloyl-ACP methyl ester carboxylesterase